MCIYSYNKNVLKSRRFYSSNSKPKITKFTDTNNPEIILKELGITTVKCWDNLNEFEVKMEIQSELKGKAGIYIIINKITRNCYVGSAITNKLWTRFSNHLLNYHGSKLVKKSVTKYGLNNFMYGILEYTDSATTRLNNEELLTLETSYIGLILPKYNIVQEAGNTLGYKHTEETKIRLKAAFTEERRLALAKFQQERKGLWSEESKLKLREVALNSPKDYLSEEGREKISKASRNKIYLYDMNKNLICEFPSMAKTTNYLSSSDKTIQRSVKLERIYLPEDYIPWLKTEYVLNHNTIKESSNDTILPYNKPRLVKAGLDYIEFIIIKAKKV